MVQLQILINNHRNSKIGSHSNKTEIIQQMATPHQINHSMKCPFLEPIWLSATFIFKDLQISRSISSQLIL